MTIVRSSLPNSTPKGQNNMHSMTSPFRKAVAVAMIAAAGSLTIGALPAMADTDPSFDSIVIDDYGFGDVPIDTVISNPGPMFPDFVPAIGTTPFVEPDTVLFPGINGAADPDPNMFPTIFPDPAVAQEVPTDQARTDVTPTDPAATDLADSLGLTTDQTAPTTDPIVDPNSGGDTVGLAESEEMVGSSVSESLQIDEVVFDNQPKSVSDDSQIAIGQTITTVFKPECTATSSSLTEQWAINDAMAKCSESAKAQANAVADRFADSKAALGIPVYRSFIHCQGNMDVRTTWRSVRVVGGSVPLPWYTAQASLGPDYSCLIGLDVVLPST